jgi:phage shock protein PspC (stress-responsive transcriptional regulator)
MKKLYRSEKDRKVAGVCGGLGEYFDIDPVIPRIVFLVLLVGAGSGILLYLVFWFIMPTESEITSTHANNTKK